MTSPPTKYNTNRREDSRKYESLVIMLTEKKEKKSNSLENLPA